MQKENQPYKIEPASRLSHVSEYYFSRKLKEVARMNAEGKNVISLGIGSPDMPPSEETINVLCENARKPDAHGYQPTVGIPELRKAMADWYKRWYDVDLDPATEIQPLIGSKEGILHVTLALVNPGDQVLVPNPGYPTYTSLNKILGSEIVNYNLREDNHWQPDFEELEKKNGKEILYQNQKMVLPGDRISKIPRITNRSEPCWVRVKITYADNLENRKGLNDTNLTGMPKYWVKKGAYFYCTRKLEQGESADIFTGVTIPEEWTEPYQEKKLGITIVADAIQAANFSPDFNAMSPWGNQVILRCIHDTNGRVVKRKSQVKLRVVFERDAHKLIAAPEDFFSGFSTAMPGDVFHDSVEIRNTTEHAAEIFFRTSPECKSVKDQEFLKNLKLVITMNDKRLYSGDLLAASLNKAVSLGEFSSGEKGNMRFEVTVPAELDNLYALRAADVKWIFSVEEDQETVDTSPVPRRNGRKESTERASGNNSSSVRTTPVKTGDESPVILFALMAGMALLTCSLTLWKGGRKN